MEKLPIYLASNLASSLLPAAIGAGIVSTLNPTETIQLKPVESTVDLSGFERDFMA